MLFAGFTALMNAVVMSRSSSLVARSLWPMYSTTTVPYWATSYSRARIGKRSTSTYSTLTFFDTAS